MAHRELDHDADVDEEMAEESAEVMQALQQRMRDMMKEQQEKMRQGKQDKDKEDTDRKKQKEGKTEKEVDKAESSMDDLKGYVKGFSRFMSSKEQKEIEIRKQVKESQQKLVRLAAEPSVEQKSLEAMAGKIGEAREALGKGDEKSAAQRTDEARKIGESIETVSKLAELGVSKELLRAANEAARRSPEDERADGLIKSANKLIEITKKIGDDAKKDIINKLNEYAKSLEQSGKDERRSLDDALKKATGEEKIEAAKPKAVTEKDERAAILDRFSSEIGIMEKEAARLKGPESELADILKKMREGLSDPALAKLPDSDFRKKVEGYANVRKLVGRFFQLPFTGKKGLQRKKELLELVRESAGSTMNEPASEKSRMLRFIADEYIRSPHPAYRSRLAQVRENIRKGDIEGARKGLSAHLRKIREAALQKIKDPAAAGLIRNLVPESLESPEEMQKARAAIDIASAIRDSLGLSSRIPFLGKKETADAALKIYVRALAALKAGRYDEAAAQKALAEAYLRKSAPRADIETLSKRLPSSTEPAAELGRFAALNEICRKVRSSLPKGASERAAVESALSELEDALRKSAAGLDWSRGAGKEDTQNQFMRLRSMALTSGVMSQMVGRAGKTARAQLTEIFALSLRAGMRGEIATADEIAGAAPVLSRLPGKTDREYLLRISRDFSEGKISREKFGVVVSIMKSRASLEAKVSGRSRAELSAYFDLALLAAKGTDMKEASFILDLARLYGRALSVAEPGLSPEQAAGKAGILSFVRGVLGNFGSNRDIRRGRRLIDGKVNNLPEIAAGLLSDKTLTASLGKGDLALGLKELSRISKESAMRRLGLEGIVFQRKAERISGKQGNEKAFRSEQKRLIGIAAALRKKGDGAGASWYEQQAAYADRSRFLGLLGRAKALHQEGVAAAMDALRGGDRTRLDEARTKLLASEQMLAGLGTLDTSIRKVNTLLREAGRAELFSAMDGLSGVKYAGALGPLIGRIRRGTKLVRSQETVMKARDFGIWRSKRELRDVNVLEARGLIGRMIKLVPEENRSAYTGRLNAAGTDTKALSGIYLDLSRASGCQSGKDRTLYFDAVANEIAYRKAVGLYRSEKFKAADAARSLGSARIKLGSMAASNWINEKELVNQTKEMRGLLGAPDKGLPPSQRNLLYELISHMPEPHRKSLRERLNTLKNNEVGRLLDEAKGVKADGFDAEKTLEAIKGGRLLYYDANKFDGYFTEAARLMKKGGPGAASSLAQRIGKEMNGSTATQKKDNERFRFTFIANYREKEMEKIPKHFEKIAKDKRGAAEADDRNKHIARILNEYSNSIFRSAKDFDNAAELSEKARDVINKEPGRALDSPPLELAAAIAYALPQERLRKAGPGGKSIEDLVGDMAEAKDPLVRKRLSMEILKRASREPDEFKAALEKIKKDADPSIMAQVESLGINSSIENSEKSRIMARKAALLALKDMREDLRLADFSKRTRETRSEPAKEDKERFAGLFKYSYFMHRENAARGAELALAALKNDRRFSEILIGKEKVIAPIYESRSEVRPWNTRPFSNKADRLYLTVYSAVNRLGRQERKITLHKEFFDLARSRSREMGSYMVGERGKLQLDSESEKETVLKLGTIGIKVVETPFVSYGILGPEIKKGWALGEWGGKPQDSGLLNKAYEEFSKLKEERDRKLFTINTSLAGTAQEKWLSRINQRLDQFHKAGALALGGRSDPKEIESILGKGGPLKQEKGEIIDKDQETGKYYSEMVKVQGLRNVGVGTLKMGAAGLGFALSPFTGGASAAVTGVILGGEQLWDAGKYYEQQGGWDYMGTKEKIVFGVQLSLARLTAALPLGGEMAKGIGTKVMMRHLLGEKPGLLLREKIAQRSLQIGGYSLLAGGSGLALYQSPDLFAAVKRGEMTWWEGSFNIAQAALPYFQAGLHARRSALQERTGQKGYRSPVLQMIEAVTLGTPFETKSAQAAALANSEFRKLPQNARDSYENYINGRGLSLTPEQQASLLARFRRMVERGEGPDFAQFAAKAGELPKREDVSSAERMRIKAEKLSEEKTARPEIREQKYPEGLRDMVFKNTLSGSRAAGRHDEVISRVNQIEASYRKHLNGEAVPEAKFFETIRGYPAGKQAREIAKLIFDGLGIKEIPAQSVASKVFDLQSPKFNISQKLKEKMASELSLMEKAIALSAPESMKGEMLSAWRSAINTSLNRAAGSAEGRRAYELVRVLKAFKYLVGRACENPAKAEAWMKLIEMVPDPVAFADVARKANSMTSKDVVVEEVKLSAEKSAVRDRLHSAFEKEGKLNEVFEISNMLASEKNGEANPKTIKALREKLEKAVADAAEKNKELFAGVGEDPASLIEAIRKDDPAASERISKLQDSVARERLDSLLSDPKFLELFKLAGEKVEDIRKLASGGTGEQMQAVRKINEVIRAYGLVITSSREGSIAIGKFSHVATMGRRLRGYVLEKGMLEENVGGFYQPGFDHVILSKEALQGGHVYAKELFAHEIQHLLDQHAGVARIIDVLHIDKTENIGRTEATAIARQLVARLELGGAKGDAVDSMLKGAAADNHWKRGWEIVRDYLGSTDKMSVREMKGKLKNFIDDEYKGYLNGLGYRDIFSQRYKSPEKFLEKYVESKGAKIEE